MTSQLLVMEETGVSGENHRLTTVNLVFGSGDGLHNNVFLTWIDFLVCGNPIGIHHGLEGAAVFVSHELSGQLVTRYPVDDRGR